jgi:hypothetical protein
MGRFSFFQRLLEDQFPRITVTCDGGLIVVRALDENGKPG